MTNNSFRSFCATALLSVSLVALGGAAFAQEDANTPLVKNSKGDTIHMTCEHARSLVHGAGGTVLTSGPYHYDLYHTVAGGTCSRLHEELQPAFVRAKDTPVCFVGYTCELPSEGVTSN